MIGVKDIAVAVKQLEAAEVKPSPCVVCGRELILFDKNGTPVETDEPIICGSCAST